MFKVHHSGNGDFFTEEGLPSSQGSEHWEYSLRDRPIRGWDGTRESYLHFGRGEREVYGTGLQGFIVLFFRAFLS